MVFQTINLDDESNLKTRHAKQERERESVWCVEEGNGKKTGGIMDTYLHVNFGQKKN